MQKNNIPVGIKSLSKMMEMTESEVRFFPKLNILEELIKNYNYNMYDKNVLIEKISCLEKQCLEENLDGYVDGICKLIKAIRYIH